MKISSKKIKGVDLYFIFILSVYFFSRLYLYVILKIDLNSSFKETLVQYLDVDVLKNNLAESLFYLHSQPPLFNFLIGITEITFGINSSHIYLLLFNIAGCLTAILGFLILEQLDVNKKLAVFFICVYLLTPATILYENLFFYTHPIIFFLVFSSYHFIVYLKKGKNFNAFLFFCGLSAAVLTTSFFHLAWFLVLLLLIVFQKKANKIILLKMAAIPFIIILSLYLKNYFVFGEFNSSSWLGMNLSRITVHQLDNKVKSDFYNKGLISKLSTIPPFTQYADLDSSIINKYFNHHTGIAVLDSVVKRNNRGNFNNYAYLTISKKLLEDDFYVIKSYPEVYLAGILKSFKKYFDSPTQYKLLTANSFKIHKYNKLYNAFIYGTTSNMETAYTTPVIIIIIILLSVHILRKPNENLFVKSFIWFALINIFYTMIIGNFLELGENNRFRYYTEIFYVLLLAIIINELIIKPIKSKTSNLNEYS